MKASLLQQGHTVFCRTSRDASHNDGFLLQKTRIFLKTHTKRLMFHYQLFYSVQLAFLVLGSIFDGGVFQKKLIFCYF